MKRIRVVVYCPLDLFGGGARLFRQLIQAIARHEDIEVIKITAPPKFLGRDRVRSSGNYRLRFVRLYPQYLRSLQIWLGNGQRVSNLRGTVRAKWLLHRRVSGIIADWRVKRLAASAEDCDVIFAFWPHMNQYPASTKPVVCLYQDTTLFDFPEILGGNVVAHERNMSEVWLREAAQVVASSRASKANLLRIFGDSCQDTAVISHAILPDSQESKERPSKIVATLPEKYIVFPASVISHKNHYQLFIAWARFAHRNTLPLVLCGHNTNLLISQDSNDWQINRIIGVLQRYGLRPNQDFYALGSVPDEEVMPLIRHAAALIMPTLAEGGGSYPVEEALSVGVPVLCSDIPVMREHLAGRSAKIGWFDPESADSIVKALDAFFDDYEAYKQSALLAMHDHRPTWDDIAAQYVKVFKEAIAKAASK